MADAIEAGIGQLVCDHFAYADAYDETNNRYLGLKATGGGSVVIDGSSVVVTPEAAKAQLDAEQPEPGPQPGPEPAPGLAPAPAPGPSPEPPGPELPKRFYGTVEIDADRAARDVGRIAEEVLQHLTTLPRSSVRITLEIEADVPGGVDEDVQRTVTENCQTLRFRSQGFATDQ